jgi:hypothetical protein
MTADVLKRALLVCAVLLLPVIASAQESISTGTLTDSTGGVLPGVTVVAINEAAGNRPNWTIETEESSANFGQRISGQYRTAQLCFRVTF